MCCLLSHFSHVRFFPTPWTVACYTPLSMGFSRQRYWSGLPFPPPGDFSDPGTEPTSLMSPALAGRFFTTSATWDSACCCRCKVTSVVSNSVQPQRRQPIRLPRPWDSPGKNTGVGCHFLLQCMKVKSQSEVTVVSDPQRPHGLQPTRLLRPWDLPGKSTGVGCHCLLRLPH